jgi:uncharacterized protein
MQKSQLRGASRRVLPIFPLPDVVFFPETLLPLHIFEARYREMLEDALAGESVIGIQLLDPSREADPNGRPAVFDIGCAGEIVEHEPLEDGRSNIVLSGLFRYRIEGEVEAEKSYRIARVSEIPVAPLHRSSGELADPRSILTDRVARLAKSVGRPESGILPAELSDEGLVNEALSRLGLDTDDRYRLLSMNLLDERYNWVLEHIEGLQKRLDLLEPYRRGGRDDAKWN